MGLYEDRQDYKRLRQAYRDAVKKIACGHKLMVNERANVHPMEDGAFVEVQIWVTLKEAQDEIQ